ncbi:MAG: hypothetical protein RQ952_02290 [Thermoproteota archaeon]|nr:hypothetical protein [Thermoproteota archaeon]
MKLAIIIFIITLLSYPMPISVVASDSNSIFFKYLADFHFSGNVTSSQYGFIIKTPYEGNLSGLLMIELKPINTSCYQALYRFSGKLHVNYKLLTPKELSRDLNFSNSTILCSIKDIWKIVTSTSPTTQTYNFTRFSYNYVVNYKGVVTKNNVPSVYLASFFNSSGTIFDNKSKTDYSMISLGDYYFSLVENIPIEFKIKTSIYLNYTTPQSKNVIFLDSLSYITLNQTNYNLEQINNYNVLNFKTNLGVNFTIITNSTVQRISISGSKLSMQTNGTGKAFLSIFYGKPNLAISLKNIDVKINGKSTQYNLLYLLDYSMINLKYTQSVNEIEIDLGSNVGFYNYTAIKSTQATSQPFDFSIIIIAIIAFILALLAIFFLRRRY